MDYRNTRPIWATALAAACLTACSREVTSTTVAPALTSSPGPAVSAPVASSPGATAPLATAPAVSAAPAASPASSDGAAPSKPANGLTCRVHMPAVLVSATFDWDAMGGALLIDGPSLSRRFQIKALPHAA